MAGDIEAMSAFCRDRHRRIVGLLTFQVGDAQIAQELAQDTMVRVCQHWETVSTHPRPDAWVSRTAINLANSWFRRRGAERRAHARHGADADRVGAPETASAIAVRAAVAALPRRRRTAIGLRYFADLSVAETAEVMGVTPATVRALTHQAIRTLRDAGLVDDDADTDTTPVLDPITTAKVER